MGLLDSIKAAKSSIATAYNGPIEVTEADAQRAIQRGITPEQSAELDRKLALAQARFDDVLRTTGQGSQAINAALENLGTLPTWMAEALKAEKKAAGAPILLQDALQQGIKGESIVGPDGKQYIMPTPVSWGAVADRVWADAVQDPNHAFDNHFRPSAENIPDGYTHVPDDNPINPLVNPAGAVLGAGVDAAGEALKRATDWAVPDVNTEGLDRFSAGGGGNGMAGLSGNASIGDTRSAPTVTQRRPTPVSTMTAAQIADIARANAGAMQGAKIDPITGAQIATVGESSLVEARRMDAAKIDPAALAAWERVEAGQMSAEQAGPAAMAIGAEIRRQEQAEMRARQLGVLQQLQDAADGKAPSVAQLMLQRQADQNISQQRGLAAGARGNMVGLAAMNAATNIGQLNQQAALDKAILRAQEMATARGQLGQATDSVRNQDIGLETSQAGLYNAVNLANQSAMNQRDSENAALRQDASKTNLGTSTQVNLANQATAADVDKFNSSQLNTRAAAQAGLAQDANKANQANYTQVQLANAQAQNTAAIENARLAQQAYSQDATADNARKLQQAQMAQQAAMKNLETYTQVQLANANAYNTRATNQAQLDQGAQTTNVNATNTRNITDANNAKDVDLANQKATLDARSADDARDNSLRNASLTLSGQALEAEKAKIQAQWEMAKAEAAFRGGVLSTLGETAGTIASDRRIKKSIADGESDIRGFLDALGGKGKTWRYKDQEDPRGGKGQRWGQMAQDIERTPVGRSLVSEDVDGVKVIDARAAVGVMLAALAQQNARINKLSKGKR